MGSIGSVDLAYTGYHRGAGMITAMQGMALGVCGYQHTLTRMDQKAHEGGKAACSLDARQQVGGAHGLVVSRRMVFGEIISPVSDAGLPEGVELALSRMIT